MKHLVLIHGFLENTSMWSPLIERGINPHSMPIWMPQLPGHGSRTNLPVDHTMAEYVNEVAQQLPTAPGDTWCVVGHSMGGYLAATLAATFPERIAGIAFFHSKAGSDDENKKNDRRRAIVAALENKTLYVRTMVNSTFHPDNRQRLASTLETLVADASTLSVEAIVAAQESMIERTDRLREVGQLDVPKHYFAGENDLSVPLEVIKSEYQLLPGSTLQICPSVAHMAQWEAPDAAASFIRSFAMSC